MADMSADEWDTVMHTNLRGTFLTCREAARAMGADAIKGRIVVVSSAVINQTEPRLGHYNTSKAALLGLTRSLAVDLGPSGIRVNCVAPGLTETDQARGYITPELRIGVLDRAAQPQEIASAITFLASPLCGYAVGSTFLIDGGQSIVGAEGPA